MHLRVHYSCGAIGVAARMMPGSVPIRTARAASLGGEQRNDAPAHVPGGAELVEAFVEGEPI